MYTQTGPISKKPFTYINDTLQRALHTVKRALYTLKQGLIPLQEALDACTKEIAVDSFDRLHFTLSAEPFTHRKEPCIHSNKA